MNTPIPLYDRHRFPSEIISHCVWRYFRFNLSYRDVEELMRMRGVTLTDETVRDWCLKFGQTYAPNLRRQRPRLGDQWHLDEVFIKIHGRVPYLWRAVDQDGDVLDILVQSRRDKKAAQKFTHRVIEADAICAQSDHHRPAAERQRGEGRDHAKCRAPPAEGTA